MSEGVEPEAAPAPDGPSSLSRNILILLSLIAIGVLGIAAYWALLLGYADRLFHSGAPEAAGRAARLVPGDTRYPSRSSIRSLQEVVRKNPYDSGAWIALGLAAESKQDFPRAAHCFQQAATVDKTYEPRWTLANYYFRRGDRDNFWLWSRKAAGMAYQDQSALFDLCWRMSQDPNEILNRAIPDHTPLLGNFLAYLVTRDRLEAAEQAAARLLPKAGRGQVELFLGYCDRMLAANRTAPALEAWNDLAAKRLIPYSVLRPAAGASLTNGEFRVEPLSHGFDWRVPPIDGVSRERDSSIGLRIGFSGRQPERCRVLEQLLPLAPSRRYRLSFEYRTSGVLPNSGLRWVVTDPAGGREISSTPAGLASEEWSEGTIQFTTAAGADRGLLALVYQRAPGATRIEGALWLRRVTLQFSQ